MSNTVMTAVAPSLWGTTYLVTTVWLPDQRPLLGGALRALPGGLLLLAFSLRLPRGEWWLKAVILGVLNIGIFFVCLFYAAYRIPGGVAAILMAVQPLTVATLSSWLLTEKLRIGSVVAGMAAVGGVALLVLEGAHDLPVLGVLVGIAGAVAMSLGMVLTKRWGNPVDAATFTGWQLMAGGMFALLLAIPLEGVPAYLSYESLLAYAYLAVFSTLVAYLLWFRGLRLLPVSNVAFLSVLSPAVAVLLGFFVLGEGLTSLQWVGMVLALLGLLAGQLSHGRARRGE